MLTLGLENSDIEVRSDSNLLVQQVNGEWQVRNPKLKLLHERVSGLLPRFKRLQLKWIQRDENDEADVLTKEAYESYMRTAPKRAESETVFGAVDVKTPNAAEKGVIFCPQCSARIPMDSKFCKECGAKQE